MFAPRDGGQAEIYATVDRGTLDSLMITNFSAGAVLDLLAEFVRQADAVVLPAGGPTRLAAETQRRHLPGELQGEAVVVLDGGDTRKPELPLTTGHPGRQMAQLSLGGRGSPGQA